MKILKDYVKSQPFRYSAVLLFMLVPFIAISLSSIENFMYGFIWFVLSAIVLLPFNLWYDTRSGK